MLLTLTLLLAMSGICSAAGRVPKDSGDIESGITVPHIAAGGGWSTEFQVLNLEGAQQPFVLSFFDSAGNPMEIDLFEVDGEFIGRRSQYAGILGISGVRFLQWRRPATETIKVGYASLDRDNFLEVGVNAVLTDDSPDQRRPVYQASVPGLRQFQDHIRFPFVNSGGFRTTLAWKSDAEQGVTMIAWDSEGRELCRWSGQVQDEQHEAFVLQDRLACIANRDGLIEIFSDFVGITAIAFLFHPEGAFTTQLPWSICCLQ